jgi:hypothetical protein
MPYGTFVPLAEPSRMIRILSRALAVVVVSVCNWESPKGEVRFKNG